MHPLLNGSDTWRESENWRDTINSVDLAVRYLMPIAENPDSLTHADFRTLAEIGAAISFLRNLPSQMRGPSCTELIKQCKRRSSGPKRGLVRGLVGFAVNPLGSTINVAASQIGKATLSDDAVISDFAQATEAGVVDAQLEYVWTHASEFPYEDSFDNEAGRRAYWLAFVWNEQNHLDRFPAEFVLTPELANQGIQRSQHDLHDLRNNPDRLGQLWLTSPLFASNDVMGSINRVNELKRIVRSLSKGKTVREVEMALEHYHQTLELRERHIRGFATRMRWTGS